MALYGVYGRDEVQGVLEFSFDTRVARDSRLSPADDR